jgi:anti-sigma factor RsiW
MMKDDGLRFQCSDVHICAAAWLDGQLSPAESEFMEEHLSSCTKCEKLILKMNEQLLTPPTLRLIQDDNYWREMDEVLALELHEAEKKSQRKLPWRVLALYAAALILTVLWGLHHRQRAVTLEQVVERQQRTLEHLERISAQPESPKTYVVPAKYVPARMEL